MERLEEHEAETIATLDRTLAGISETTLKDTGRALRSVHAKCHGILRGDMTVDTGLPPVLAQGLFAKPGVYPVVMRYSTIPGDILDDSVSTPRGLAIKVIGVEGERLEGSEQDVTQDFVLVNGPAFAAPSAKQFAGVLKVAAATTDRVEGLKKFTSAIAQGLGAVLEAFGVKSATLATLGGQAPTHILGETYYSQAPILFGDFIAKIAIFPVSPELQTLKGKIIELDGQPNPIRSQMHDFFKSTGGVWEVRVQLCTDISSMPIENSSVEWPEKDSPYLPVATISVSPQNSWDHDTVRAVDDGMSFSPWHGIAAHRPLGSIMRARRTTYAHSAAFRSRNGVCPVREPRN